MKRNRRFGAVAILLVAATGFPGDLLAADGKFEGIWNWGEPGKSTEVPFLRISRDGARWTLETKHYMHDNFVSAVRDVHVNGNHLEFSYWYDPLARWARCNLDLADDKMTGFCDGELNARQQWGSVPTYLWRGDR